ncbi:MAG: aminoalkylphosphonic acid N-acetyltransferase [Candidatus Bathyarchaeota archaeon BA1]|nr:MAG: aminoalkylphosphonic acid N-acetyltransferase [Candidatus Bathyarchaeota archaeon BA1]
MNILKVRSVDENDLFALVVLAEEFMPGEAIEEKRIDMLRQALEKPNYELLVAELNGEIVGFIDQWVICDFAHGAKLSYIQNLYVASQHRGKGVGSRLLQEIIKNSKKKGVLEIHAVTGFNNKPAVQLYKKYGLVKESLQLEMEFK